MRLALLYAILFPWKIKTLFGQIMKEFTAFLLSEQENISKSLQAVTEKMPCSVQEIARYAFLSGGKRLRPVLTLLWYNLLKTQNKITHPSLSIYDASIVLEMFHVASLLHDDVLDNAELRRGKTSSHIKFGVRPCLLAGDALLAMGNKQMAEFQNVRLMQIISDALLRTANGEIEEIQLAGKIPADEKEYLDVIEGKTAWIIRSACEVGAIMAGASEENIARARDFGLNLGMAFQIVDDALDFSPEDVIGKPTGGDLRERKCTPPIYMYLQSLTASEKEDFIKKFQANSNAVFETAQNLENGFTDEELKIINQKIIDAKFPEKTRELAQSYLDKARESIAVFSNPYANMLLEAITFIKERNK